MLNELRSDVEKLLNDFDTNESLMSYVINEIYDNAIKDCLEIVDKYISIYGDDGK